MVFFFFFQAEDGIRDLTVTGVQTCALPICDFRTFHGSVQDLDANIWAEFLLSRQDVVAGDTPLSIPQARHDTGRLREYFAINTQGQFVRADRDKLTGPPGRCPPPPPPRAPSGRH